MDNARLWFWILAFGAGCCVLGAQLTRNFMFEEAVRCLEAPDIDTARVCWDAATLGWTP